MNAHRDHTPEAVSGAPFERALARLEALVDGSESGEPMLPGERLPTVRAAAESWRIQLVTVNRAYRELERRGPIVNRGRGSKGGWYTVGPDAPPSRFARAEAAARQLRPVLEPCVRGRGSCLRARPVVIDAGKPIPGATRARYPQVVEIGAPGANVTPVRFARPIPFVLLASERGTRSRLLYLGGWVISPRALAAWIGAELGLDTPPPARGWAIDLPPDIPNAKAHAPLAILKVSYWQHDPSVLAWASRFERATRREA